MDLSRVVKYRVLLLVKRKSRVRLKVRLIFADMTNGKCGAQVESSNMHT